MKTLTLILVTVFLLLAAYAQAQIAPQQYIILFGTNSSASGSNPACTNSLDFSKACNSQYLPFM